MFIWKIYLDNNFHSYYKVCSFFFELKLLKTSQFLFEKKQLFESNWRQAFFLRTEIAQSKSVFVRKKQQLLESNWRQALWFRNSPKRRLLHCSKYLMIHQSCCPPSFLSNFSAYWINILLCVSYLLLVRGNMKREIVTWGEVTWVRGFKKKKTSFLKYC